MALSTEKVAIPVWFDILWFRIFGQLWDSSLND